MKNIADHRNPDTQTEIKGSYVTPDGKAQIDFGITYRNGYPEFTATGNYSGSSGQCIEAIKKAYPRNMEVDDLARWHSEYHLKKVSASFVSAVNSFSQSFPFRSFYDAQAETFLATHGLKFRATLSDSKTPAWSEGGKCGHHYRVTISRPSDAPELYREPIDNFPQSMRPNRLTFDFWSSIADAEKGIVTVKPYDVLACISTDAYTPTTFADFCAEYGYEEDSIKALQMFRRCDRFAKRLRDFFTEQELTDLSEIR